MAIDNSVVNNIYNYYLTTYAPKSDTKFDTHKKSELRGVYNSIVKLNKEAPVVIVDKSAETREYAIGLKENARSFRNILASLGGLEEGELLNQKVAYSSDESVVTAEYVGPYDEPAKLQSLDVIVEKLATPQVNEGNMLEANGKSLGNGAYSFDISTNGLEYEFQYNVTSEDNNRSIQDKLARLITNAGIGLRAQVVTSEPNLSALKIESVATGDTYDGAPVFTISDNNTSHRAGSVKAFGLDNMVQRASSSTVEINDNVIHTANNTFVVDKEYQLTLNQLSYDRTPTRVGLRADSESMKGNVRTLIQAYNVFVDTVEAYSEKHPRSGHLASELKELANVYSDSLENMGISMNEDERLTIDEEALNNSLSVADGEEHLAGLKKFAGAVLRKSNQVSLDPMKYVDKRIVAYKNPGKNYATPYTTSAYTGMMFNSYC